MAEKKYKFSIVTAVYNIDTYLEEAINSVLKQDIGFEKNVQLILVDDGATDRSGEICDKFEKEYPDNIVVIHKKNGGVSSARNEGLKYVKGEYVNFLDGDDKLSENALSVVYEQFSAWRDEIDLVTIPVHFFDATRGEHCLNNKFKEGTRIINLVQEYDKPLFFINATFVKRDIIQKFLFDERLSYAEDAKMVMQILFLKKKYGVIAETQYLYRKRSTGNVSAIQGSQLNKKWYLDYILNFDLWLVDYSKNIDNRIPLFVQFTLMYDLQWRFRSKILPGDILTEHENQQYIGLIRFLLNNIQDSIILQQRQLKIEYKLYVLKFKYGTFPESKMLNNDICYFYGDLEVSLESENRTIFECIRFENSKIVIEGEMIFPNNLPEDDIRIFLKSDNEIVECEKIEYKNEVMSLGESVAYVIGFKGEYCPKYNVESKVSLWCEINGALVKKQRFSFGEYCSITSMWNSYVVLNRYIVMFFEKEFHIYPYSLTRHIYRKLSYLRSLLKKRLKTILY